MNRRLVLPASYPKGRTIHGLLLLIALVYMALSVYAFLNTPMQTEPDTAQYKMVAEWPILSADYWLDWRPTITPLLFKAMGNNEQAITWMQLLIGMAAWIAFAGGVAALTHHPALKVGGFAACLVVGWATDYSLMYRALLTEGISYSLFTALVAVWLWALVYWQGHPQLGRMAQIRLGLLLWLAMTVWTVSRYTNVFALLAYAVILGMVWAVGWRKLPQARYALPIVFVGAILPFLFESQPVSQSDYWKQGLMNALAEKILPYPERRDFFVERGMPATPEALAFSGYVPARYYQDWTPIYGDWLDNGPARRTFYIEYIVLRPFPRIAEMLGQWQKILDPDIQAWSLSRRDATQGLSTWQQAIHYLYYDPSAVGYLVGVALVLLLVAGLAYHHRRLPVRFWIPLAMLLTMLPLAFLIWFGDAYYERVFIGISQHHKMAVVMLVVWGIDWLWGSSLRPSARYFYTGLAGLLLLTGLVEASFGVAALRNRITYPIARMIAPNVNLFHYWGVSDDEYQAYQAAPIEQPVLNMQHQVFNGDLYLREFLMHWAENGASAELRRDRDPDHGLEIAWRNHPAPYGIGVSPNGPVFGGYSLDPTTATALRQWQDSRLPANLSAVGIHFVQVEDAAWLTLPAYQQRVLHNPMLYRVARQWEGQTLYEVVGEARFWDDPLPTEANPLGIDPDEWGQYQDYDATLIEAGAVVFNPAGGDQANREAEQQWVVNTLRYAPPPAEALPHFWELLSLLDGMQFGEALPNQAALTEWRTTKQADLLAQAGADYLLVTQPWYSWLSDAELAMLNDPSQYTLVATWEGDLPRRYWLYRIGADPEE